MRTKYTQLYKNYMAPEDPNIIGLEEDNKKIKGIAEFSFNDKEALQMPSILDGIEPKKKIQPIIVIQNAGRSKHRKSGKTSELF